MPRRRVTSTFALIAVLFGCGAEPQPADLILENVHLIDAAQNWVAREDKKKEAGKRDV